MKKLLWMLLMLALCIPCASAQEAAAFTRAPLLDAPNEAGEELMRYYIGTRVEVVREVDACFVQVNVGTEGGSLMGYMDRRDLEFGEENIRSFRAERVTFRGMEGQTCKLYSFPDKSAPVIDPEFNLTVKRVIGYKGDEWLHVQEFEGGTGFVARDEIEGEAAHYDAAPYMYTQPLEGELSLEAALTEARRLILEENPAMDAAYLDARVPEIDVLYYYGTPEQLTYSIDFRSPETGYIDAGVSFLVEGETIIKVSFGNG